MNPTVVTIASHRPQQSYYVYDEFFNSLARWGCTPVVIKEGYGGLGSKPRLLKKAIESGKIESEHIIFTDCFDVLFAGSPEEVLAEYLFNFNGTPKIVWNAEKNCFPDAKLADKHPPSQTSYRYFNSGFAVGPKELFLLALKELNADSIPDDSQNPDLSWNTPNDQGLWMNQFLFGNINMTLDRNCRICQTLCNVQPEELDFSGPRIRNKETDTVPIVFHMNGNAKEMWKHLILNKLGL